MPEVRLNLAIGSNDPENAPIIVDDQPMTLAVANELYSKLGEAIAIAQRVVDSGRSDRR